MHIQLTTTGICHICFRSICFLRCNSVKCDHQDHVKNIINFTRLKYSNQKVIFYANFLDCHFRCVWMIPSLKRKNRLFRQTDTVSQLHLFAFANGIENIPIAWLFTIMQRIFFFAQHFSDSLDFMTRHSNACN